MKNDVDLRFAIAIDSDLREADLVAVIKDLFPDFVGVTAAALKESKNMLVMSKNEFYSPDKINEEDGWLYYRYELSVFPMKETTLEYQRNLADLLLKRCGSAGLLVELVCDDDFND